MRIIRILQNNNTLCNLNFCLYRNSELLIARAFVYTQGLLNGVMTVFEVTMSDAPEHLRFAKSHEWVKTLDNGLVEVGISDFAQQALGDVVYVELPEVDDSLEAGQECCAVESVKAASDIYAPISGRVVEVNTQLDDEPEALNESPYESGWIFRIEMSDDAELDALLSAADYLAQLEDE